MIFLASLLCAFAETPVEAVHAAIVAELQLPPEDVVVQKVGVGSVPEGTSWTVSLLSEALWGTVSLEMNATFPDGNSKNYRTWAKVSVWAPILVAAEEVEAGEKIPVRLERQQLDLLYGDRPVDPDKNWRARVSLEEGEPLTRLRVDRWPDAVESSSVELVARRGALSVRAPGRLEEDAWVGQRVEVLNLLTQSTLIGIYEADGTVCIGACK